MSGVVIPEGAECDNCGNELEQEIDGEAGSCTSCGMSLKGYARLQHSTTEED